MLFKDYLDSKKGEEFRTLLAYAFQDSYDFEESSYGELEVAAAFHHSVYNMMTAAEIETFYINISCSISILFSNIHCFSTSNLPAFNASNFFCFLLLSLIPFPFSNAAL